MSCKCHSGILYWSLVECPECGHSSLDRVGNWEGCERRACGYQRVDERSEGAARALERIERLRAKWDAPDSGGDQAWAAVGSEAHKIASTFLEGRSR